MGKDVHGSRPRHTLGLHHPLKRTSSFSVTRPTRPGVLDAVYDKEAVFLIAMEGAPAMEPAAPFLQLYPDSLDEPFYGHLLFELADLVGVQAGHLPYYDGLTP